MVARVLSLVWSGALVSFRSGGLNDNNARTRKSRQGGASKGRRSPRGLGGRDTICEVLAAGNRLDDPPLSNQGEPDRQDTDKQAPQEVSFPPTGG